MNPEIQSLRVVVYATKQSSSPDGLMWSGVAELHAELKDGGHEQYFIRPGTRHSTKGAAIEAARAAFVQDMAFTHPLLNSAGSQPLSPAPAACYL
jgi:hypothetical protein